MCAGVLRDVVGSDGGAIAARFGLGRVARIAELPGAGARNALIETDAGSWVLRLGLAPSALGSQSSRLSAGLDVLRSERFFASAIRETTRLRSPWPYEIDAACDLISVPYAVMPRLPGRTLWWSEDRDWKAIGAALAEAALELHRRKWPTAGYWDPATDDIASAERNPAEQCRAQILDLMDQAAVDDASRQWTAEQLTHLNAAPTTDASLIHGDFVIGNVCMTDDDGKWSVAGTFDLENSRIGDSEEDIVGHLWWACYGGRPEAAVSFLRRYHEQRPVSTRIYPYVIRNLLGNWEYGQRMGYPWYGDARTFGDWAKPLMGAVDRVVAEAIG